MVFDLVFSKKASDDLHSILIYLEREWSLKVSKNFTKVLDRKLLQVASNPITYPAFKNKKQIRKCVVNKNISMFYRIRNREIQIITLFDNRKNPKTLVI